MLIEINLLPVNLKRGSLKARLSRVAPTPLVIGVVSALVIFELLSWTMLVPRRFLLASLERKWRMLAPERTEIETIAKEISVLKGKTSVIEKLSGDRFLWAEKLDYLSTSVTPGIWLTKLYLNEEGINKPRSSLRLTESMSGSAEKEVVLKYLEIEGCTLAQGEEGTALVGRFIKSLKTHPGFYGNFKNIKSRWIKRMTYDDTEVMNFKLSCLFKDESEEKNEVRSQ